jgi:hypothetical protein
MADPVEQVTTPATLAAALYQQRYRYVDELELQDAIEALLIAWRLPYAREAVLSPRDRIDFLVDTIGIEVKVGSSLASVERQLWRYAADSRIGSLILVTSRSIHKGIPQTILEKPVYVVHLLHSVF